MAKIEVEHRGLLIANKFKYLNKFLEKNGKFIGEKDRFSVIYFSHGEEENFDLDKDNPIDLRIRITNKKSELVLKYGKWSGSDARKEFSFPLDPKKFGEMAEFLNLLGFYYGALQATKTFLYFYRGIEFALVEVPGWGYYFEAEITTDSDSDNVEKANKKIASVCAELNLKILNDEDFYKVCKNLNVRPGFRFNFKKEKFDDVKKRFENYF